MPAPSWSRRRKSTSRPLSIGCPRRTAVATARQRRNHLAISAAQPNNQIAPRTIGSACGTRDASPPERANVAAGEVENGWLMVSITTIVVSGGRAALVARPSWCPRSDSAEKGTRNFIDAASQMA
jgi:hypothetical protein